MSFLVEFINNFRSFPCLSSEGLNCSFVKVKRANRDGVDTRQKVERKISELRKLFRELLCSQSGEKFTSPADGFNAIFSRLTISLITDCGQRKGKWKYSGEKIVLPF